jgi:hypothetical protein
MIGYNQRIKFSIILVVLLSSIVYVLWYHNKLSAKLDYVGKRIDHLDDQLLEASILPIKIENAFSKYNSKKSELDLYKNLSDTEKVLKEKIEKLASNNRIKIKGIIIKRTDSFKNIKRNAKIEEIPFIRQSVEVNVVGNFLNIGLFLEAAIKNLENLNLNNCEFDLDQDSDRQVKASIEFYTYALEKA